MNNPELILRTKDINNFISTLPQDGPFAEELIANKEKSGVVFRSITDKTRSKKSELHENYTDIFIIHEGSEELFVGGEIEDSEETRPGEWRGKGLIGARKYQVEAGDIVIVPKGVAHQHGEGVLKMIALKIK